MNNLFEVTERRPDVPTKVAMFRATPFRSLSSRDERFQKSLLKRMRYMADTFAMEGEPADEGERLVYRTGSNSLQIYRASDSVWWINHDLAYRDMAREPLKLLPEEEARDMAQKELYRI